MSERLDPVRAARLLRAKAGELEAYVAEADHAKVALTAPLWITDLAADIALVAGLLADHLESHGEASTRP